MATDLLTKLAVRLKAVPRRVKMLVGLVVVAIVLAVAVPATLMSHPGVIGRIGEFSDNHTTLQASLHADLACGDCHVDSRGRALGTVAAVADFYRTVLSPETEPAYIDLAAPTADACRKCHMESWSDNAERTTRIPHPAHLRLSEETRDCVECHKWTAHLEDYLEEHKSIPFSGVCAAYGCHSGWKGMDECADCHHTLLDEPAQWQTGHADVVFARGDGGCLELCHEVNQCRMCHTTGETPFTGLPEQTERDVIETAHARPNWTRVHGAVALEDQSVCSSCHISVGPCQNCHARRPDSHGAEGTWISAHKDAVDDDRQCVTCHERSYCDYCHDQFKEMR